MKRIVLLVLSCMVCFLVYGDETLSAGDLVSSGMTAYSEEQYIEAIDYFKRALKLRPDHSTLVYNIACCYALENMTDSALVWLNKAIDMGVYRFSDDPDFESLKDNEEYRALIAECDAKIADLADRDWLPVIRVPEDMDEEKQYPAVIALHGFGSNPEDFARAFDSVVIDRGYILCCPYGPEIRGATSFGWGGEFVAEMRINDAYTYLIDNLRTDTTRIVLLGYSQGGYYTFYFSLNHPAMFSGAISVAGYYSDEFDDLLTEKRTKGLRFYLMIGELDRAYQTNVYADSVFQVNGMSVKLVSFPDLGHAFPSDKQEVVRALEWIESRE